VGEPREPYPYDLDRAKRLMAEAGYSNGFDAKMWIFPFAGRFDPAEVMMAVSGYWREIGIDLDISTHNIIAVYGDILSRKTTGVCAPLVTDTIVKPYYDISTAWCYSKAAVFPLYESTNSDAILDVFLAADTAEEKEAHLAELAQYWYDEYAFVPLLVTDKTYVTRDTVANWKPTAVPYLGLEYATHPEPLGTFRLFEP